MQHSLTTKIVSFDQTEVYSRTSMLSPGEKIQWSNCTPEWR